MLMFDNLTPDGLRSIVQNNATIVVTLIPTGESKCLKGQDAIARVRVTGAPPYMAPQPIQIGARDSGELLAIENAINDAARLATDELV
jgi:hypothetical protein